MALFATLVFLVPPSAWAVHRLIRRWQEEGCRLNDILEPFDRERAPVDRDGGEGGYRG